MFTCIDCTCPSPKNSLYGTKTTLNEPTLFWKSFFRSNTISLLINVVALIGKLNDVYGVITFTKSVFAIPAGILIDLVLVLDDKMVSSTPTFIVLFVSVNLG